jgi:hypothetical protein
VSLSLANSEEDVDNLVRALRKIAGKNNTAKKSKSAYDGTTMPSMAQVKKQMKDFIRAAAVKVYD